MAVVEYEKRGHLVIITMNRPERLNAMGKELVTGLSESWVRYRDDPDARVAILTGVGRSFCVGMDVKERLESGERGLGLPETPLRDPYWHGELEKPTIAAVNGFALGGGITLVTRADLRVAVESATLQFTEIVRGGLGGFRLGIDQALPYAMSAEIALGGLLTARRAYEIGLINRVVPTAEELMPAAIEMAEKLLELPPLSVQYTIQIMRTLRPKTPPETSKLAAELGEKIRNSEDALEAQRSFAEKRKPVYKGR